MRRAAIAAVIVILIAGPLPSKQEKWAASWMYVTATGYCPCKKCCGRFADGITYCGTDAWKPGVAVDPEVIPHGSRLDIPGYKRGPGGNGSWILADDTGSGIQGRHIDVRFKTHSEAVKWGRKYIKVRVWKRIK